ncbi:MAG: DUF4912 domain-containing protein [Spirochaetes bacterium]|nr:DUF4912 domain-containing protein [Spirochaetota bacterium]
MYTRNDLKAKTVKELKEFADNNNVKYINIVKKDKLIALILDDMKSKEIDKQTKVKSNKKISSKTNSLHKNTNTKQKSFENSPNLPGDYGKDKMVFMIKDPYWGFVYWEITDAARKKHNLHKDNIEKYLRIYDISDSKTCENPVSFFDIKINEIANNWYINFKQPNKTFIVDLGYFKDNDFITVLRSNSATSPRDDVSDQLDQEWMLTDEQFKAIFQASGANTMFEHDGSQELMKFLAGNIEEGVSSGGA